MRRGQHKKFPSDLDVHVLMVGHAVNMIAGRTPMPFGNETFWRLFIDETLYLIARSPALIGAGDRLFPILNPQAKLEPKP